MGWGSCGKDSTGRPIGYSYEATCDHPGCNKEIDRGLSYACGGMHGDGNNFDCEKYFCEKHLFYTTVDGETATVCQSCWDSIDNNDDYIYILVDDEFTSREEEDGTTKTG